MNPSTLDPQILKAFDATSDLVKQILTLSTGMIAVTVAFLKDVVRNSPVRASLAMKIGWVCFILAIMSGLWTMAALAGTLGRSSISGGVYQSNILIPLWFQEVSFICGVIAVMRFGWVSLNDRAREMLQSHDRAEKAPALETNLRAEVKPASLKTPETEPGPGTTHCGSDTAVTPMLTLTPAPVRKRSPEEKLPAETKVVPDGKAATEEKPPAETKAILDAKAAAEMTLAAEATAIPATKSAAEEMLPAEGKAMSDAKPTIEKKVPPAAEARGHADEMTPTASATPTSAMKAATATPHNVASKKEPAVAIKQGVSSAPAEGSSRSRGAKKDAS